MKVTLIEEKEDGGMIFVGFIHGKLRNLNSPLSCSRMHKQPNRIYSAKGIHPALSSSEAGGRYYILCDRYP